MRKILDQPISRIVVFERSSYVDGRGSTSMLFNDNFFEGFQNDDMKPGRPRRVLLSENQESALRGFHLAKSNANEHKLISCIEGSIRQVLIDVKPDSPTYLHEFTFKIQATQNISILIGPGIAHAYLALQNHTKIIYCMDTAYQPNLEFRINPLDPDLSIDWPKNLIISEGDINAKKLNEDETQILISQFRSSSTRDVQ